MKTENDFLLEVIDSMASCGIDESLCSFIYNETGLVSGVESRKTSPWLSQGAKELLTGIYGMVIGEMTLGYTISKSDIESTIDEFTDYILLCNKG
jgi:hypothetical protein